MAVGVAFGVYEGAIYQPPRFSVWLFWALLVSMELAMLAGFLGWVRACIFLPVAGVVQDAFSLFGQGSSPWVADWYAAYYGRHWLTENDLGVPHWYIAGFVLTLGFDVARRYYAKARRPSAAVQSTDA